MYSLLPSFKKNPINFASDDGPKECFTLNIIFKNVSKKTSPHMFSLDMRDLFHVISIKFILSFDADNPLTTVSDTLT